MLNLTRKDGLFCLRWTLATAFTLSLCGALGALGVLVGPLAIAIAQALALRGYWRRSLLWGIATTLGGYVTFAVFFALYLSTGGFLPFNLLIAIAGAVWGLSQSFVLRLETRRWYLWAVMNAVVLLVAIGWFMPLAINAAIYGSQRWWWQWSLLAGATGLMGGALKSVALALILRRTGKVQTPATLSFMDEG